MKRDNTERWQWGVDLTQDNDKMLIEYSKNVVNGKTILEGTVMTKNEEALPGANVHIKGTAKGTTVDLQGNLNWKFLRERVSLYFHLLDLTHRP